MCVIKSITWLEGNRERNILRDYGPVRGNVKKTHQRLLSTVNKNGQVIVPS